ncbi:recombinase family protein [Candidatus Soleaferrea massiliensis]|uniref:recombinase family protein n=1 Tax=Candidatus Soleaferrea massiliensis TaxID=1470354 RepID=UPI0018CDD293|nr:recombinase family protein [Candidatus Soleaferrea massiliensis]
MELVSANIKLLTTRQKSIDGVAEKAKTGQFLGGIPPVGYDIINGKYVINPYEAHIVQTIFRMYADGYGYGTILDELSGAKGKRGKPLGKNSLNSILTNERYIGVYTWNKRKVKMLGKWAGGIPNENVVRLDHAIEPII